MTEAREVVNHWMEAFNAHDEDGLRALSAADAVLEAPGDVHLDGRDAVVGYEMNWLAAFPDAEMAVEDEVVTDGWVVQRFTFEGTHSGTLSSPMGDIAPTNRHLIGRGAQFMRVDNGVVAESHLYFDQMQVLAQLGLVGEPVGQSR